MMRKYLLLILLLGSITALTIAQNEPVIIEAESGTLGSDYATGTDGGITYIYPQTDVIEGTYPATADKVATYEVTFPAEGEYALYLRLRVGAATYNDDSYFYANGFGTKDPATDADWITCNGLASAGYTANDDVVMDQGSAASEVWKWVNFSDFTGLETPLTFTVEAGSLTQTFQIGAREDGLFIDKLAFGLNSLYFTVSNLDNGEAGSTTPPEKDPIGPPLAEGLDKFLGCSYGGSSKIDFTGYWNQVTSENGGKWGYVEGTRDQMNWGEADEAYNLAIDSGLLFKHHVLVWGSQQPGWMPELDSAEQRAELEEWFNAVALRYPKLSQVEVVNEPLHAPPDAQHEGGYIDALGGSGATGWDWIIEAFRMADTLFNDTVELLINEYSIMNSVASTDTYRDIIDLLVAEDLIDGIGIQAHGFSHTAPNSTYLRNLDTLAASGLPIYVTELDIDGQTDQLHVQRYMNLFPLFWEHPAVKGITLWGYRPGMWRSDQGAYLIDSQGNERPAMTWLRAYLKGEFIANETITVSTQSGETSIDSEGGTLQLEATFTPENATLTTAHWYVNDEDIATISEDGVLTAVSNGTVTVTGQSLELGAEDINDEIIITITGQELSVENFAGAENIRIYPNPVENGFFSIKGMEGIKQLSVLDMNGNQVLVRNVENLSTSDISLDVPAGMYFVRLTDGNRYYHSKIVVR